VLCAALAALVLLAIIAAIAWRGVPALSFGFLFQEMRQAGASGGIFYHIIGTLILLATALALCAPLAVATALTHSFYVRPGRLRSALSLTLYTLNGVPSILFGILGLIVFVKFLGWGKSWLSGGLLLGIMILPTVCVSLMERIQALPKRYVEAAYGLGLRRSQVVRSVVLPQTVGGLVTGCLLGLARAAGETAPIMFAASVFSGATIPNGVQENPVLSLAYHVFVLAQDSFSPQVATNVWGTVAVLLALVFCASLVALPVRLRVHEEARDV